MRPSGRGGNSLATFQTRRGSCRRAGTGLQTWPGPGRWSGLSPLSTIVCRWASPKTTSREGNPPRRPLFGPWLWRVCVASMLWDSGGLLVSKPGCLFPMRLEPGWFGRMARSQWQPRAAICSYRCWSALFERSMCITASLIANFCNRGEVGTQFADKSR